MINRFKQINLDLQFVNPVYDNDPRLENTNLYKRTSSIMLQHLDSIRHFYENTSADHCVVCEDDIFISKNLSRDLPEIVETFRELNLMFYYLDICFLTLYTVIGIFQF